MPLNRRELLAFAAASTLLAEGASAKTEKKAKRVPPLALNLAVAELDGKPVVSADWVKRQVLETQRLLKPHRLGVGVVERRVLTEELARLETAEDRDAVAAHLMPKAINAFFVKSLRNIDDPESFIRGVRWRKRSDLSKDYVIVSSIAGPFTLCHEIGHFLGNGHSQVVNNVMSYKHEDRDKIQFDERQGAKMRLIARRLLRRKKVLSVDDYRRAEKDED